MRFAVSSYSFSQAIRSGNMTQADCVEKAKEMGFEGVEFTDLAGGSLEEQKKYAFEIKERASKAGIEVVAYTIGANLYRNVDGLYDMQLFVSAVKYFR